MLRAFVLFGALLGMMGCLGSTWAAADEDAVRPLGIGLEEIAYPYPVQFLDLVIEGQAVRMAYMDVLPTGAGNGKTAVLLQGKSFSGNYWETAIRRLADVGYRVVVPDQIGFGKSSKPDVRYSFDLLAANTKKLLDTLGIRRTAIIFSGVAYAMYTQAAGAWVKTAAEETRLIDAMRKGADLTVKGTSARGTATVDVYSLRGLPEALNRVGQECK